MFFGMWMNSFYDFTIAGAHPNQRSERAARPFGCIPGSAVFTASTATTGKAALFIPLIIAASLFQYSRFARFRQPAFCGRFARRAVQLLPGAGVWGEHFPGFGVVQHILKPQPDPIKPQRLHILGIAFCMKFASRAVL